MSVAVNLARFVPRLNYLAVNENVGREVNLCINSRFNLIRFKMCEDSLARVLPFFTCLIVVYIEFWMIMSAGPLWVFTKAFNEDTIILGRFNGQVIQ